MEVGATRPQHSLYVPSPVLETIADRFRAYLRTQHGVHLGEWLYCKSPSYEETRV